MNADGERDQVDGVAARADAGEADQLQPVCRFADTNANAVVKREFDDGRAQLFGHAVTLYPRIVDRP
jgi:hypothetical protein